MPIFRLLIKGRVQGVGYRIWLQQEAIRIGLTGWVRNRRDGSVEAVVGGQRDQIEAALVAMRAGPPGSRVDDIALHDHAGAVPQGFSILPTA